MEIKDYQIYNTRMRQSMYDKLWWVDKIRDCDKVFDYGCADGSLLRGARFFLPSVDFIGYDNDKEMIERANDLNIDLFTDFTKVLHVEDMKDSCVVLSSVFHEIWNYSSNYHEELAATGKSGAKYVAIRDMFFKSDYTYTPDQIYEAVVAAEPEWKLKSAEEQGYDLHYMKDMVEYLLTKDYEENWDKEIAEAYFTVPLDLVSRLYTDWANYKVVYREEYVLPYIDKKIEEEFGFKLSDYCTTHAKILFEKIEN